MPPASVMLRLVAFAVPASLALAGVQPMLGAAVGGVGLGWAISLAAPAVGAAVLVYIAARLFDRGDAVQPPWYSAWVLMPGAFLLAGAAAMCIFGALIELTIIRVAMLALLVAGTATWAGAIVLVRRKTP
jgi:hypothetical protein